MDRLTSSLHEVRLEAVSRCLLQHGARTVLDLGCGKGELLANLAAHTEITRLVGIDIDARALASARTMLGISVAEAVFGSMCARLVIITTSNEEFNRLQGLASGSRQRYQ